MKMCASGGAGLIGVFGLCCLGGGGGFAQNVPKLAGSLDASFFSIRGVDPIWDQEPTVQKISVQADGAVLISGRFDQIQGWNRASLGRVLPNGSLDRLFVPPRVLTAILRKCGLPAANFTTSSTNAHPSCRAPFA